MAVLAAQTYRVGTYAVEYTTRRGTVRVRVRHTPNDNHVRVGGYDSELVQAAYRTMRESGRRLKRRLESAHARRFFVKQAREAWRYVYGELRCSQLPAYYGVCGYVPPPLGYPGLTS